MDDYAFREKYKKYKLRVKLWETDFKKKNGRVPSKHDIREATKEIRDSYKMYYKLKTSFLEDTLNDVLADDGYNVLEISQASGCGEDDQGIDDNRSLNGGPTLPTNISAILEAGEQRNDSGMIFSNLKELPTPSALANLTNRDESHVIKKFEAVEEFKLNQKAWGAKVSNNNKVLQSISNDNLNESLKEAKSFKSNLNSKLFKSSSSFSKRNPRKSLSRANLDASLRETQSTLLETMGSQPEALPDLETILTQKAKEQQLAATAPITSVPGGLLNTENKAQQVIKTNLDIGWLERNTAQKDVHLSGAAMAISPALKPNSMNENQTQKCGPPAKRTFGLSNIDVSKFLPTTDECLKVDSMNHVENVAPLKITSTSSKSVGSDSDSVVSGSDCEEKTEIFNHRVKRRRLLATVPENPPDNNKADSNRDEKGNEIPKSNLIIENMDLDEGRDFSADSADEDPNFVPEEEKPLSKRKKAVAKRTKSTKNEPKVGKPKREPKSKSTPNPVKPKTNAKRTMPSRKKATKDTTTPAAEIKAHDDEKPPNVEDLKNVLKLDGDNITSVPRANSTELELAEKMAKRYITTAWTVAHGGSGASPKVVVNEKRAAAIRKLQEKINSGRLNENFVRINIEKKRYVRGKKTINYSKYKKQQWRHKKRVAALCGPNMPMGGCDGVVLKCFTCGQAGHFAQDCKIKGDALLPLTAQLEEDPSPFPTLEEVAEMATQTAVVVHSSNIAKLPEAANTAALFTVKSQSNEHRHTSPMDVDSKDEATSEGVQRDQDEIPTDTDIENDEDDDDGLNDFDVDAAIEEAASNCTPAEISPIKQYIGHKIPEAFLKEAGLTTEDLAKSNGTSTSSSEALYALNADGTVKEVTPEVLEALHLFGHTSFRKGQDRAIMRILSGLSTLVTLSTGSGKSLCYQLPAYLYSRLKKSITLVVSPLVSLMEDQVTGVPHFLRAHCLHTNQTKPQRLKVMQMINDGEIDILLVSPEAVVAGEKSTGFGSILRQLPPIAFACIDEAHCVSQWSHNFRPSYLMICKVLKHNLGVQTVLGLTATATLPTRLSIIDHLGIPDGEDGVISDLPLPDNLVLSVSKDEHKDAALLQLLNSERFEKSQSIIIYCTRRDECERVAGFLRTCMQNRKDEGTVQKKRKRVAWQAEPYHAGMASSRRRVVQNAFMKNELRIVVATIAFGMGINKPDIRAIIHYNMPRNFESYVQEIGRAGRDGLISNCHLFLDSRGGDQNELRRHIYANSIDRHVIRKLLANIFVPCSCAKTLEASQELPGCSKNAVAGFPTVNSKVQEGRQRVCPGHEIGFSAAETVEALDIPEENIATLLCYMELDRRWHVNTLSSAYMKAKVISYGGPKYLKYAAKQCPPLAMAVALAIKRNTFKESENILEFHVIDIAAAIGWNSGIVKHQLKNLEWITVNGRMQRSPISVQFMDLGFRIKAPGDFTTEEIDEALDTLYQRSVQQERTQLIQLQYVFQGLSSVAFNSYKPCIKDDFPLGRSEQLKAIIRDYFRNDYPKDYKFESDIDAVPDDQIVSDIHGIINMYPDNNFSGRTIARIFYGIQSPNYPAIMWGRCKYWRAHCKSDFNRIVQLANTVIVKRRT